MQWTDEQIGTMRKLASEGFTRRETADKLGISYDAVQKKSRRLGIEFQSPMPNEYDSDGTQSSETILKVVSGHKMTPREVLEAHGYDYTKWELVRATSNFWKQTPEATLYQSKIQLRPKAKLSIDEIKAEINAAVLPVNYGVKRTGTRNLVIPLPDLHLGWTTFEDLKDMVSQLREIIMEGYDQIVIEQLGDLFHSDQIYSSQTVRGTILDHAEMRTAFHDAVKLFDQIVPLAIQYSNKVSLKSVFGNHSGDLEYAFLFALDNRYPQLDVDFNDANSSLDWRTAYLLGHVGIMLGHGDVAKNRLAGLFPIEYKGVFTKASTYEIHSGHWHTERFHEDHGIMWRQLGTPKPNDPYEIKNGFTTGKHLLYAFVYDEERLRCTYELN